MWGNLLLLSVLACTVVIPVLSQMRDAETIERSEWTIGKSGEKCTKQGRKCISEADCKNHRCKCPPGKKGDGQFECVNRDDYLCLLYGDPHIKSFSNSFSTINLPCRVPAARFVTKNKDTISGHGHCSFEIFVIPEHQQGRYVVKSINIALGMGDYANQRHSTFHISKTAHYSTNASEVYHYQTNQTSRHSIWGSSKGNQIGWNITCDFDKQENFALLDVEAECGVRIKFRAFNPWRLKHQTQMPGASIMVSEDAEFVEGLGDYPNQACGTTEDPKTLYRDRAGLLGFNKVTSAIIFDMLAAAPNQKDNPLAGECERAFDLFNTSSNQVNDVASCAFILDAPKVGKCIGDSRREPLTLFNCCMAYMQNLPAAAGCSCAPGPAPDCDTSEDWPTTAPNESQIGCGEVI